jgi:hypothetical protein
MKLFISTLFIIIYSLCSFSALAMEEAGCVRGTFETLNQSDGPLSLTCISNKETTLGELEESVRRNIPKDIKSGYLTIKGKKITKENYSNKLYEQDLNLDKDLVWKKKKKVTFLEMLEQVDEIDPEETDIRFVKATAVFLVLYFVGSMYLQPGF